VLLDDNIVRTFLPLIDGTRTVDDLVGDLKAALGSGAATEGNKAGNGQPPINRETVHQQLRLLAGMALLVA
jgi:hypothetical protein